MVPRVPNVHRDILSILTADVPFVVNPFMDVSNVPKMGKYVTNAQIAMGLHSMQQIGNAIVKKISFLFKWIVFNVLKLMYIASVVLK